MNTLLKITITTLASLVIASTSLATTPTPEPAVQTQGAQLTVTSATARPSMDGSKNSAAYISLHNNGAADITIIGATSMTAANNVELHTITDESGVKKMVRVDKLVVPAGGDLVMQTGGIHIMLLNLKTALNVGNKFDIELHTIELGTQIVSVEVVNM
jgi:copper(I)-binding protein